MAYNCVCVDCSKTVDWKLSFFCPVQVMSSNCLQFVQFLHALTCIANTKVKCGARSLVPFRSSPEIVHVSECSYASEMHVFNAKEYNTQMWHVRYV